MAKQSAQSKKRRGSTRRSRTGRKTSAAGPEAENLEQRLAAMRSIGDAFSNIVGLDPLFQTVVPHVTKLMGAARSTLFLFDPDSGEIWSKFAEGEGGREIRLKLGHGIAGWVAENRTHLNIPDAYDDERFNPDVDARTGFRTKAVLAMPLLNRNGELLGVLQVLNAETGEFTEDDLGLLEAIATQTSYAVENARQAQRIIDQNRELEAARHRAERRRAELDLLYQLEQETTASADLDALLDSIIVRACERLRSEAGSVLLLDEDSGRLFFRGVTGEKSEELKNVKMAPGEGLVGWVAQHGEPIVVNRPEEDPRHDKELAHRIDYPAQAILAVPLVWDKTVIGTVEVLNPEPRPTGAAGYDLEDLKVLTVIAGQVARAIALTKEREARVDTERLAFIGRMLAGVAHDLRNPMTVISGYAQMMAIEAEAAQRQQRCDRILHQIDEMTAMVSDLLAFARGDTTLHPSEVDVESLADELRTNLTLQCEPRGIELVVAAEGALAQIDLSRAKRIIYNLARNAVEVLTDGGRLDIELESDEGGLTARVRDSGPGIPPEIQANLFQPFVTAGKGGGTGLGLSIVKRFVEDHGGSIEVESTPGKGAQFVVALPAATLEAGS